MLKSISQKLRTKTRLEKQKHMLDSKPSFSISRKGKQKIHFWHNDGDHKTSHSQWMLIYVLGSSCGWEPRQRSFFLVANKISLRHSTGANCDLNISSQQWRVIHRGLCFDKQAKRAPKVTEASLPVMNEIPLIPLSVNNWKFFFVWAMSRSVETTELCAHAA